MTEKLAYFFGNGKADGNKEMKEYLGGKGAGLAEMTSIGIPVPPGFTIATQVCEHFNKNGKKFPPNLEKEVDENLKKLENIIGKRFGDPDDPLLVSVRSGAAISMPGMMDTILNLGLNDKSVEGLAKKSGNARFAYDAYRRLIQMFGDVVMGVPHSEFEKVLEELKREKGVKLDTELDTDALKELIARYKELYKKYTGQPFPQDAKEQLWKAITAVFESWDNPRAKKYRELNNITGLLGTAVNVQAMVFGNMGERSGTGVAFTRNPATGENTFYGEFLLDAQGEDVVAGIRTPQPVSHLSNVMPNVYNELIGIKNKLEQHYRDMQDLEFTIQDEKLYLLQTRTAKRTAEAALRTAVEMVHEGLIDKKTAIMRVQPDQLNQLLHPRFDPKAERKLIAKGLPASPGAATGKAVFDADEAEKWAKNGERVVLVRLETSPEDIGGMAVAQGILTARGGMTSHAAVVARGMGKPCVAGCGAIQVDHEKRLFSVGENTVREGDFISIDGATGEVMLGEVTTIAPEISGSFAEFMSWADEIRKIGVRTNADTPKDAQKARDFGAEGIGLTRTEHMFFEGDRIWAMREMIIADNEADRRKALEKLLPYQREDFYGILKAMQGLPVTIRLLDPPLHEFLPKEPKAQKEMAQRLGISVETVQKKVTQLSEINPMLGHRGCRLGITYPEITEMQTRAIFEAACDLRKEGIDAKPEVMIPLTGTKAEVDNQREVVVRVAEDVMKEKDIEFEYAVGTMIEIPRAAIRADKVAEAAEFFSFGTNDLTQMTFGYSRDDAGVFLPDYLEKGILPADPFQTVDQDGVGELIKIGIERGRRTRPELQVGICGEHGGDPESVKFCHRVGMNYVSCSPFRVPIARLAAAHSVVLYGEPGSDLNK